MSPTDERILRDAVKNARSTFYNNKGVKRKSRKEIRKSKRDGKKKLLHLSKFKNKNSQVLEIPDVQNAIKKKKKKKKKKEASRTIR